MDLDIRLKADTTGIWIVNINKDGSDGDELKNSKKTWEELGITSWDSKNDISDTKVYHYIYKSDDKDNEDYNIQFNFTLLDETSIEYYRCKKNKAIYLGHTHYDTSEVLNLIQDINDKNKILKITVTPLFQTFSVIDRAKKKKSGFFIRRYYSM